MKGKFKIDKMIDNTDSFTTEKDHNLFNLPMRVLMIAKTGDAKSTTLGNLLLKSEGYRDDFEPENIYIFSGSLKGDEKLRIMIQELEIPSSNLFNGYDGHMLEVIYDLQVEEFNEKINKGEKRKPKLNTLFIFDDLAYSNAMTQRGKENEITKIFMNGRKYLISCIVISQKYSSVGTSLRENASGLIIGKASNKQLDLIADDHNYLETGKKAFQKMFRKATDEPFSKLVINFSKPELYFDTHFQPIQNTSDDNIP